MAIKTLFLAGALILSQQTAAACPDYLATSMRELHSKNTVNPCESFQGSPMLLINTASHCGYTPQFKGLVLVGFASDDFRQEDDEEARAAEICYINCGVTFTMLAPSHVRGDEANPVFRELASKTRAPRWNFNKYLVDHDGIVVQHFGSNTLPASAELQAAIEQVL